MEAKVCRPQYDGTKITKGSRALYLLGWQYQILDSFTRNTSLCVARWYHCGRSIVQTLGISIDITDTDFRC